MTTDIVLLFLIKWLGALGMAVWLVIRFLKAVSSEVMDFQDWWSAERRARDSRRV